MKILILSSAILLGICLCARSADSTGLRGGRDWLEMNTSEKFMYIHGAHDMAVASPIFIFAKVQNEQKTLAKEAIGALDDFTLIGLYPSEVIGALDGFYANASNVRVPILLAIKWVKLKGNERDAEAARLRAIYPNDGK